MNLTKAPEKGLMYATYIDKMIFEPYCRDELTEAISEEKLLELHLFDQDINTEWFGQERVWLKI